MGNMSTFEVSVFYRCWRAVNRDNRSDALFRNCLCVIRPQDAFCDDCNISFNSPECCQKVFDKPLLDNELELNYCCGIYKTHKKCNCRTVLRKDEDYPEMQIQ